MKRNLLGISLVTLGGLYVLLSAIIILVTILIGAPVITGIGISIAVLIIQFLVSPFFTDLSMKWFYKAKFKYEVPEYLKKFIEEVCASNNMKYPRIGYIDDGAPNAFTYGHTKNDARIVLTRGIFELLTEEEVKAVVAHELGHAVHYDMLFMTVAQLVPLFLYGVYEICTSNDNDNNNNSYLQSIGMLAYILYVISNYVILWLSRTREYYADELSIETTKNPNALASALVKIGYGLTTATTNKKHSAAKSNALGIFDSKASKTLVVASSSDGEISKENIKQAMKWEQWNVWAKWYEFNSTHPLISKRLLAISNRSKDFGQEPYIVFDLEKTESYVDDFLVEVLINFMPTLTLLISMFVVIFSVTLETNFFLITGVCILVCLLFSFIKFKRQYRNQAFKETTVRDLLSEVKVSHITSIPCSLEGTIIGRGNPGCIFNEDFVIKDSTGIIFLDYNQPIHIVNKIFALFKSPEYFDKNVKVTGWYRRSPVPYVELKTIEIDGKVKKVYTYKFRVFLYVLALFIAIALIGISIM
ncbi:MAG: M48 family metalloprotease [Bacilli bacterium]|nr:M48 family metalloprotease [Bacilli bacterium]